MKFLSTLLAALMLPGIAFAGDLAPRAEINLRAGTDRSILMTELWAPLAQQSDRVLYGDLRLMGDDGDNYEGNLGLGYRQIIPKFNSVLGGSVWIDRRKTENGNYFNQLTLGVESLGDKIDLRANAYIQLNSAKTTITPNIGSATPYLSGTGIFYDTNGFIIEEPQDGVDAEIGYRLPIFQKHIDATRVYGGGYHFWGDTTDNVTGFRLRTEAQVNSIFSVGARFQHDGPRGSQGFLEATLRFPFKSKKLYQEHGLRSRLDESPERDIDIVTGTKVDSGLMKPVLTQSGDTQRILYIDNTNTNAGDGTKENPYNTLALAQAALEENDIIYVSHGDGTTKGMDQGFVINKANVQMIGSGTALTYSGFTLLDAGLAPVITNTQTPVDSLDFITGNGVLVLEGNTVITGITVDGAKYNGIRGIFDNKTINSITITNVTAKNNGSTGIAVLASNNAVIDQISYINNVSTGNIAVATTSSNGMAVNIDTASMVKNIFMTGNIATGNATSGLGVNVNNAVLDNLIMDNNQITGNGNSGLNITVPNLGVFNKIRISNIFSSNNANHGIVFDVNSGTINDLLLSNSTISNSGTNGVFIQSRGNGTINQATLVDVNSFSNTERGVNIAASSGVIGNAILTNINSSNNVIHGILLQANNATGIIGRSEVTQSTGNGNGQQGLFLYTNSGGIINESTISRSTFSNNGNQGISVQQTNTGGDIRNVSISETNTLNNSINGIILTKSNASAAFIVDMGGGSMNSIGQNRSFGNGAKDLRLNYTGGGSAFAKFNWWGTASGLQAGRVTLSASTTVDASAFLTTDPRP